MADASVGRLAFECIHHATTNSAVKAEGGDSLKTTVDGRPEGGCVPGKTEFRAVTYYTILVSHGTLRWTVSRRFQQFKALNRRLRPPNQISSLLPPKKWYKNSRKVVGLRRRNLPIYLQNLADQPCAATEDFLSFITEGMQVIPSFVLKGCSKDDSINQTIFAYKEHVGAFTRFLSELREDEKETDDESYPFELLHLDKGKRFERLSQPWNNTNQLKPGWYCKKGERFLFHARGLFKNSEYPPRGNWTDMTENQDYGPVRITSRIPTKAKVVKALKGALQLQAERGLIGQHAAQLEAGWTPNSLPLPTPNHTNSQMSISSHHTDATVIRLEFPGDSGNEDSHDENVFNQFASTDTVLRAPLLPSSNVSTPTSPRRSRQLSQFSRKTAHSRTGTQLDEINEAVETPIPTPLANPNTSPVSRLARREEEEVHSLEKEFCERLLEKEMEERLLEKEMEERLRGLIPERTPEPVTGIGQSPKDLYNFDTEASTQVGVLLERNSSEFEDGLPKPVRKASNSGSLSPFPRLSKILTREESTRIIIGGTPSNTSNRNWNGDQDQLTAPEPDRVASSKSTDQSIGDVVALESPKGLTNFGDMEGFPESSHGGVEEFTHDTKRSTEAAETAVSVANLLSGVPNIADTDPFGSRDQSTDAENFLDSATVFERSLGIGVASSLENYSFGTDEEADMRERFPTHLLGDTHSDGELTERTSIDADARHRYTRSRSLPRSLAAESENSQSDSPRRLASTRNRRMAQSQASISSLSIGADQRSPIQKRVELLAPVSLCVSPRASVAIRRKSGSQRENVGINSSTELHNVSISDLPGSECSSIVFNRDSFSRGQDSFSLQERHSGTRGQQDSISRRVGNRSFTLDEEREHSPDVDVQGAATPMQDSHTVSRLTVQRSSVCSIDSTGALVVTPSLDLQKVDPTPRVWLQRLKLKRERLKQKAEQKARLKEGKALADAQVEDPFAAEEIPPKERIEQAAASKLRDRRKNPGRFLSQTVTSDSSDPEESRRNARNKWRKRKKKSPKPRPVSKDRSRTTSRASSEKDRTLARTTASFRSSNNSSILRALKPPSLCLAMSVADVGIPADPPVSKLEEPRSARRLSPRGLKKSDNMFVSYTVKSSPHTSSSSGWSNRDRPSVEADSRELFGFGSQHRASNNSTNASERTSLTGWVSPLSRTGGRSSRGARELTQSEFDRALQIEADRLRAQNYAPIVRHPSDGHGQARSNRSGSLEVVKRAGSNRQGSGEWATRGQRAWSAAELGRHSRIPRVAREVHHNSVGGSSVYTLHNYPQANHLWQGEISQSSTGMEDQTGRFSTNGSRGLVPFQRPASRSAGRGNSPFQFNLGALRSPYATRTIPDHVSTSHSALSHRSSVEIGTRRSAETSSLLPQSFPTVISTSPGWINRPSHERDDLVSPASGRTKSPASTIFSPEELRTISRSNPNANRLTASNLALPDQHNEDVKSPDSVGERSDSNLSASSLMNIRQKILRAAMQTSTDNTFPKIAHSAGDKSHDSQFDDSQFEDSGFLRSGSLRNSKDRRNTGSSDPRNDLASIIKSPTATGSNRGSWKNLDANPAHSASRDYPVQRSRVGSAGIQSFDTVNNPSSATSAGSRFIHDTPDRDTYHNSKTPNFGTTTEEVYPISTQVWKDIQSVKNVELREHLEKNLVLTHRILRDCNAHRVLQQINDNEIRADEANGMSQLAGAVGVEERVLKQTVLFTIDRLLNEMNLIEDNPTLKHYFAMISEGISVWDGQLRLEGNKHFEVLCHYPALLIKSDHMCMPAKYQDWVFLGTINVVNEPPALICTDGNRFSDYFMKILILRPTGLAYDAYCCFKSIQDFISYLHTSKFDWKTFPFPNRAFVENLKPITAQLRRKAPQREWSPNPSRNGSNHSSFVQPHGVSSNHSSFVEQIEIGKSKSGNHLAPAAGRPHRTSQSPEPIRLWKELREAALREAGLTPSREMSLDNKQRPKASFDELAATLPSPVADGRFSPSVHLAPTGGEIFNFKSSVGVTNEWQTGRHIPHPENKQPRHNDKVEPSRGSSESRRRAIGLTPIKIPKNVSARPPPSITQPSHYAVDNPSSPSSSTNPSSPSDQDEPLSGAFEPPRRTAIHDKRSRPSHSANRGRTRERSDASNCTGGARSPDFDGDANRKPFSRRDRAQRHHLEAKSSASDLQKQLRATLFRSGAPARFDSTNSTLARQYPHFKTPDNNFLPHNDAVDSLDLFARPGCTPAGGVRSPPEAALYSTIRAPTPVFFAATRPREVSQIESVEEFNIDTSRSDLEVKDCGEKNDSLGEDQFNLHDEVEHERSTSTSEVRL